MPHIGATFFFKAITRDDCGNFGFVFTVLCFISYKGRGSLPEPVFHSLSTAPLSVGLTSGSYLFNIFLLSSDCRCPKIRSSQPHHACSRISS